ncbi:uncharacterized protein PAC_17929 [Phialocephala subalpina]|uniref:Heterokaryon incompatibility domain-containing protein n=1 Tax=Phialocephala subalpina TaxID=576137 RepID=A0A1L7XSL7_9HELO|nr:uncharacterized protein PAC_17929 [Phialocephala subalpina]
MALCSVCQSIEIPNLPPFTGFNQKRDAESSTPIGQPHHQFQALRKSAPSCLLCSLLFKRFMEAGTKITRGVIGYGPDLNPRFHSIPRDEDIVLLLGLSRSGWNEKEKCFYGFQALCGTLRCNFGLFAAEGTASALTNTVVGRIPRPIEQCDRPLEWLRTCIDSHSRCASYEKIVRGEISFPTRVLDVGDSSESQVLKLVHGAGLVGRYVALSHCWGKNPVLKTTKESLDSFFKCINPRTLTKTFLDAVTITRRLGVRYLWIDSLCIVQDDNEDWEREAASMAQVYSQSLVTLAASAASDGSQGFFRTNFEYPMIEVSYPSGSSRAVHTIFVGDPFNRFQSLTNEPLNTRAWTLQERVLSPRVLHYARDQLHWECRQTIKSEAGSPPYLSANQLEDESHRDGWLTKISSDLMPKIQDGHETAFSGAENEDGMGYQDSWYGLVEAYTERDLSYGDDKLPALSGLARAYGIQHEGTYVAGLWSQDLVFGLLWYNKTNQPLRRPARYRAPSWSWASVDGPINFFTMNGGLIPERLIEIEDLVFWTSPAGPDPFGRVTGGALTVTGYLKEGKIKTIMMEALEDVEIDGNPLGGEDAVQLLFDEISAIGSVTLDTATPDGEIFCLLVANSYLQGPVEVDGAIVLLLSPTEKENQYRRAGFSGLYKAREFRPETTLRPNSTGQISREWTHPGEHGGDQGSLVGWFDDATKLRITIV